MCACVFDVVRRRLMVRCCVCLGLRFGTAGKRSCLVVTAHTCTWRTARRARTSQTTRSITVSSGRPRFTVRCGGLVLFGRFLGCPADVAGTHFTEVRNNVAFHIRGHTYFVEDGGEMYNNFENNLAAFTLCSEGPLKGDSHPANFWTSSPMNIWRHNVAAGSCGFGYWFELPGNPGGESSSPDVCCNSNPLGGGQWL